MSCSGESLKQLREENYTIHEKVIQALSNKLEKEAQAEKEAKDKAKADKLAEKEAKKSESTEGKEE